MTTSICLFLSFKPFLCLSLSLSFSIFRTLSLSVSVLRILTERKSWLWSSGNRSQRTSYRRVKVWKEVVRLQGKGLNENRGNFTTNRKEIRFSRYYKPIRSIASFLFSSGVRGRNIFSPSQLVIAIWTCGTMSWSPSLLVLRIV